MIPKYLKIERILTDRIQDGTYPAGSKFPKQSELAQEFKTSRITIRKALDHLIKIGLVYTQRGAGTFVMVNAQEMSRLNPDVYQYVGTSKLWGSNHQITSQVINFKIRYPEKKEIQMLNLADHDLVYEIKRVRFVDGDPHALEYTIMPVKVIPGIDEAVLKKSIYAYIEENLAQKIGAAYRKISAAKPSQDDQQYLNCQADDPILKVKQVVSLQNNTPFELSETHHRYDKEHILVYVPGNND